VHLADEVELGVIYIICACVLHVTCALNMMGAEYAVRVKQTGAYCPVVFAILMFV